MEQVGIIAGSGQLPFVAAQQARAQGLRVVAAAIRQELARDGQVFLVHNRVESIYSLASLVKRLVPEARVVVGHGQMPEAELERAPGEGRHELEKPAALAGRFRQEGGIRADDDVLRENPVPGTGWPLRRLLAQPVGRAGGPA